MKDLSTFQLGFLGALVLLAIVGLAFFAFQTNTRTQTASPTVVWGTVPQETMNAFFNAYRDVYGTLPQMTYTAVPENQIASRLTEALANNTSPDALLVPQDLLLTLAKRITTIPYDSYPDRTFTDAFIDHAQLYKNAQGVLGVPFMIDPLVLYWNRDLLAAQSILAPSKTWGDFYLLAPRFLKRDTAGNITQSLVGLGEMRNIFFAKDILSALFLQTGNPIIGSRQGTLTSTLGVQNDGLENSAVSVVRFFTEFSNPNKTVYSWNRSLSNTRDLFSSGKLAYYIAPASEARVIRQQNPYLNFDVALLPGLVDATRPITFGRMTAFSLLARSPNIGTAFSVIADLTTPENLALLSKVTGLPPVSRSLVQNPPRADAFAPVFYESAIRSRGWLDPNPSETTLSFTKMIEDVVSGRKDIAESVGDTSSALDNLLR